MTSGRWLTWLAVGVAVVSFPIVWLLGYQDHLHRRPVLAVLVGVVLFSVAVAVGTRRKASQPPVPKLIVVAALIVSAASLGSAVFWWFVSATAIA